MVKDEGRRVKASPGAGGAPFPQCSVKMAAIEAKNSSFEVRVGKGARIIEGRPFVLLLCMATHRSDVLERLPRHPSRRPSRAALIRHRDP